MLKKIKLDYRSAIMVLVLIAIGVLFNITTDGIFLSSKNLVNLTRQSAIVGILSLGMVLIIVSNNIDLSVGSMVGLTGAISAIALNWWGLSLPVSVGIGICTGILLGGLQGALIAWFNIPAFIVTLGSLMIYRGALKGFSHGETITVNETFQYAGSGFTSELTGWIIGGILIALLCFINFKKYKNQKSISPETTSNVIAFGKTLFYVLLIVAALFIFNSNDIKFPSTPDENNKSIPIPVLILTVLAIIFYFTTTATVFGRRIYAIGGNLDAARLSGINTKKNTLFIFMIMGALSALAGIIYTARVGSATVDAGRNLELDTIAACVIGGASLSGGKGTIGGALIGALIMASLDNGMSIMNIQDFYQDIFKGLILVTAVFIDMAGKKK